ncbi:peptidylprolyl isomerase [Paenibacillus gorillae]|uniref:peptidylprolyl isomerase n=1 Tax=Paenibacillus gorillae TaxID=1243662 RepID=UPI0004B87004|nr:peptidylprolyl isomerase [Paenibacillus gorillae]
MKKFGVLKTVVLLQAVCMIVLSVAVVVKLSPFGSDPSELEPGTGNEAHTGNDGGDEAAAVGGEPITVGELEAQLLKQYGDTVLRTMMVRKALNLEASARQLKVTVEEQDRELAAMMEGYQNEDEYYRVMKEQLGMERDDVREDVKYKLLLEQIAMLSVEISDGDVNRYIGEHAELYGDRLQLHLQWIVTKTEKDAGDVLDMLSDGEDFERIARTYSVDDFTAEAGGDLGLIDADDPFYDAELLDSASRLQTGEMAGPLKTADGYAVIRLVERQKTEGLTGKRLMDAARKQLALSKAKPLHDIEDELLTKYDAVKRK